MISSLEDDDLQYSWAFVGILKLHPQNINFVSNATQWETSLESLNWKLLELHKEIKLEKKRSSQVPQICFAADNLKLICEINFWLAAPNVDPGTAVSSLKSERGEAEKRERPTKFLSF